MISNATRNFLLRGSDCIANRNCSGVEWSISPRTKEFRNLRSATVRGGAGECAEVAIAINRTTPLAAYVSCGGARFDRKRARRCNATSRCPPPGRSRRSLAWKAYYSAQGGDPPRVESNERAYDGLRKAGMPEE
jgi:hypothetical protein